MLCLQTWADTFMTTSFGQLDADFVRFFRATDGVSCTADDKYEDVSEGIATSRSRGLAG